MPRRVDKFLVVSIDCWRYDALSRTNPQLNTPKFDLLTREYALAQRYFVTAPATRPSHSSLFTGLYPFEHGLYGQTYLKLFEGIANLFDVFDQAGYSARGFSERADVFRFFYLPCAFSLFPVEWKLDQTQMHETNWLIGWLFSTGP